MLARVASAAVIGIEAAPIDVEVDVAVGLPGFHIVGLADAGICEGRVRIRGALENSGFRLPPRKITVNLAPADLRKDGAAFDVPIAVGVLSAAGVLDANDSSYGRDDESRHLFHIGVTRAAHQLWLVATGTPSPLVPKELMRD